MKLHSIIGNVCLVAAIAALAIVYGLSTYWPVLLALPAMPLFWVLAKRSWASWRASALLCIYLALAVAAVLLKRPPGPMMFGCVATLIWWDLQDFGSGPSSQLHEEAVTSLQKYPLQSLAFTAGASLVLAGIAFWWLRIQLPFGVVAVLILLSTGCLVYAVGVLRNPPLSRE